MHQEGGVDEVDVTNFKGHKSGQLHISLLPPLQAYQVFFETTILPHYNHRRNFRRQALLIPESELL